MAHSEPSSGDEWAREIEAGQLDFDRLKKELRELLRDHDAKEAAEIMEQRRAFRRIE